ncbi:MAG: mandelate racemase [Hyphomicrobiaceae bacterium]|nr:MAG: mandelate racemase [Hyphomicrobiaceae bacterium]
MTIEEIHLSRLSIPLAKPYKLAFRDVTHFDTLLVELVAGGRAGYGEATILNGYTEETVEGSWALAQALAPKARGLSPEAARRMLDADVRATAPFTATAFLTALDMAGGHPLLEIREPSRVPLLFGINATDPGGIEQELEGALASGYRTLKIKAGFDLEADLARVGLIQGLNRNRARLRIDANQGYAKEDGCAFARRISPDSVELLEQPCHAKDWDAARAVAEASCVPLMLDEAIYDMHDIERAARTGAAFVKLKLMKFASLDALARGLGRIRELGMTPVLGNGVASDIGCWMEACVASTMIDNAGEMNGFLRQREALVQEPIAVEAGAMLLEPGFVPILHRERLHRFAIGQTAARTPEARENAP